MGCDGLSLYACSAHVRSCRSFTWRAPLKGSSRVLVRAAIHKGEFLNLLACSALAKWVHDAHLEGISDVMEPSDSKICLPKFPRHFRDVGVSQVAKIAYTGECVFIVRYFCQMM